MTTRTRESGPPGKEKRGTSPSYLPNTTQTKRSPNPSKNNSPAKTHDSTTSEKPVPNYLKPTLSSGNDFVSKQQGKKPFLSATSDSANKASLTRRRSFDKPPSSSSQTQKSRVSPSPALRSSSFSAKSTTASSQRGVLDKNSKQHGLYARPVNTTSKKGGVIVKKQEAAAKEQVVTSPTDKVDNLDLPNVPEPETLSKDQESGTDEAEDEKSVKIGSVDQKGSGDLVMEDLEPVSIEQSEGELEKDDKDAVIVTANSPTDIQYEDSSKIVTVGSPTDIKHEESKIVTVQSPTDKKHEDSKITTVNSPTDIEHVESPTVLENKDVSPGVKTDDREIESQTEEISSKQEEVKEHSVDESNNINSTDESVAGNPNEETEEKKKQEEEEAKAEASRIEFHESKQTEVQEEAVVQENAKEAEAHESKQTEVEEEEEAVVQEKPKEAEATEFETKQAEVEEEEAVVQEKLKEAEASEVETKQAEVEEAVVQEKPKEAEASEVETKQAEVQEVVVQEKLKAAENQGPKVQVMAHGKKECGVSNDHIEETASRLREQRKNRVKALAGAFESVMQ